MFGVRLLGLGAFDFLSQGEAQLKSYIGRFLLQESVLLQLQRSSSESLSTRAMLLYQEHKELEKSVQELLAKYQAGTFMPTMAELGLPLQAYNHIQAVEQLEKESKNDMSNDAVGVLPLVVAVVAIIGAFAMRRR